MQSKAKSADDILVFSPSYRRPTGVTTQAYLPYATYVVSESDAPAYEAQGHRCWVVPDSAQGSVCRIRNYILDNCGSGRVVILDDDINYIGRWDACKVLRLKQDQVLEFIEHGFNLAEELGARYWGVNLLPDKGAYREYTPFAMRSVILGPFQAFNHLDLRYDEALPLKEDYDLSLQVLNKYRITLRFNAYFYSCKQHTNPGGCASYRTIKRKQHQFDLLQKKWGSKIVRRDSGAANVNRTKKASYDINPIVRVPIRGV